MAGEFEVRGSQDLAALAARLKAAGRGDLRRELLAAIRTAGKKSVPEIRKAAQETLPKAGGLAARVAAQKYAVRTSLAMSGAKVSIVGDGMKELRTIDAGTLRHPVYGDRSTWSEQSVTPGFFGSTMAKQAPAVRHEIAKAVQDIARKITNGG